MEEQVLPALSFPTNYALADRGVYFIPEARETDRDALHFLDFATGSTRMVHTLESLSRRD